MLAFVGFVAQHAATGKVRSHSRRCHGLEGIILLANYNELMHHVLHTPMIWCIMSEHKSGTAMTCSKRSSLST